MGAMTRIDLRHGRDTANPPRAAHYRVRFNRVDVSDRCFMSDDVTGEIGLYVRNQDGAFYYVEKLKGPMVEFLSGDVVLIPPR